MGIGQWLADLFTGMWSGIVSMLGQVLSWILQVVGGLVALIVEFLLWLATLLVTILPAMPEVNVDMPDANFLQQANQYIAVSEALSLLGVWSALFAGVAIYKSIKLVSPVSS